MLSKHNDNENKKQLKFTRGEKCIFVHLIFTFVVLLILMIVYFVHLWMVRHVGGEMFRVSRRAAARSEVKEGEQAAAGGAARGAGLVRSGEVRACGALHLRRRWAVAPAHCVAARSHPALAPLLPHWTITYALQPGHHVEANVVRGIVHSRFNSDDFDNNIGLFELSDNIFEEDLKLHNLAVSDELLENYWNKISIVAWESDPVTSTEKLKAVAVAGRAVPLSRCRAALAPVTALRPHEFCVRAPARNTTLIEHGAAVVIGDEVRGLVAWGDRHGHLPTVVLNVGYYKDWIENLIL